MMVILDRIIIGIVSGAAAVTLYTVPFQFAERSTMLARSVSGALFPRLSGLDDHEQSLLAQKGQGALMGIMTPLSAVGILLIEPFLSLWISAEFGQNAATVGIIILAGFWMNCFAVIPYSLILARGRPDLIAKLHLAELLPYILMLYLGLVFLGLPGAAIAFSTRTIIDALLLSWIAGQFRTSIRDLVIPTVINCATVLIAMTVEPGSRVWFVLSVLIISFAVFRAWITVPSSVKSKLTSRIGGLTRTQRSTGRT
jgi:Membrane protein involved in the export of O-antigen and teichoic acid